jgi:hypothetical protein
VPPCVLVTRCQSVGSLIIQVVRSFDTFLPATRLQVVTSQKAIYSYSGLWFVLSRETLIMKKALSFPVILGWVLRVNAMYLYKYVLSVASRT